MSLTLRQQMVAAVMGVGLILFLFELIRRRRLREEHSWLWMLSAGVILLFALCPPVLRGVTGLVGASPASTLFFLGFFFLMLICIHYAVKISTLTVQLKNLMQELAILRERLEREGKP